MLVHPGPWIWGWGEKGGNKVGLVSEPPTTNLAYLHNVGAFWNDKKKLGGNLLT